MGHGARGVVAVAAASMVLAGCSSSSQPSMSGDQGSSSPSAAAPACESGTAPAYDGTVTPWGEQAKGGQFLVRAAEPVGRPGESLQVNVAMRFGGTLGTVRAGRHLVLASTDGMVCDPVLEGDPGGGAISVNNSSTTQAELKFAIPADADPADFSLFVVDAAGMAQARFAAGSPKPTTRPADQCPGVHLSDDVVSAVTQEVDFGAKGAAPAGAGEPASMTVAAPQAGASSPGRKDAPGPVASTSLSVTDDPGKQIALPASSGLEMVDGEGNMCPLWSVGGTDPEFAQALTQESGATPIEFVTGAKAPAGARVILRTGMTDPSGGDQPLTLMWR